MRTLVGMAALAISANIVGVLVVAFVTKAMNATANTHQLTVVLVTAAIIVGIAVLVGVPVGALVQRRTLRWLLRGDEPSAADAHRAMRLPLDMALLAVSLWTGGGVVVGIAAALVGEDAQTVLGLAGGTVLSGLGAAGLTYLLIARVNRPVALLALAAQPPKTAPVFGLGWRLVLAWVLTTATPIVGLVLVLTAPKGKTHVVGTSIVVAVIALLVSGLAVALSARSIGEPLRDIVTALDRVGKGDLEVRIEVDDAGEIGLVQNGFNDMVEGLRERERIQDLFGRHVGSSVAAEAISGGVTMSGESREVVALFVDVTGSTQLTRETEPRDFVRMLNRFFEVVVDEVEQNSGLLNKFEGDAALCVFGAPNVLDDAATAALRAARAIRERVVEIGEFGIGIGVASGPVIAGQIGSSSRPRVHRDRRGGERRGPPDRAGQAGGRVHPGQRADGRGRDRRRAGALGEGQAAAPARARRADTRLPQRGWHGGRERAVTGAAPRRGGPTRHRLPVRPALGPHRISGWGASRSSPGRGRVRATTSAGPAARPRRRCGGRPRRRRRTSRPARRR